MTDETIYRINFINQGEVYEVYARNVSQGGLFGFIEIEELVFGERSKLLIDSSEERLKTEFEGVRRIYVPLHSVLRIDEVAKAGRGRITAGDGPLEVRNRFAVLSERRVDHRQLYLGVLRLFRAGIGIEEPFQFRRRLFQRLHHFLLCRRRLLQLADFDRQQIKVPLSEL